MRTKRMAWKCGEEHDHSTIRVVLQIHAAPLVVEPMDYKLVFAAVFTLK